MQKREGAREGRREGRREREGEREDVDGAVCVCVCCVSVCVFVCMCVRWLGLGFFFFLLLFSLSNSLSLSPFMLNPHPFAGAKASKKGGGEKGGRETEKDPPIWQRDILEQPMAASKGRREPGEPRGWGEPPAVGDQKQFAQSTSSRLMNKQSPAVMNFSFQAPTRVYLAVATQQI